MEFSEEEATGFVHRDKLKEMNVLEWIALVIQEPLQVTGYHIIVITLTMQGSVQIDFFLRDGVRICQLINKIKEGAINKADIVTGTTEANRANIVHFLRAAGDYGVPAKYLFEVILRRIFHFNAGTGPLGLC